MEARGIEALVVGIEMTVYDIGREHVFRIGVRVSEEVGQADGGKREVIAEGAFIEFDHVGLDVRSINRCVEPSMFRTMKEVTRALKARPVQSPSCWRHLKVYITATMTLNVVTFPSGIDPPLGTSPH